MYRMREDIYVLLRHRDVVVMNKRGCESELEVLRAGLRRLHLQVITNGKTSNVNSDATSREFDAVKAGFKSVYDNTDNLEQDVRAELLTSSTTRGCFQDGVEGRLAELRVECQGDIVEDDEDDGAGIAFAEGMASTQSGLDALEARAADLDARMLTHEDSSRRSAIVTVRVAARSWLKLQGSASEARPS